MENNTSVVPTGKVPHVTPQHGGYGTHPNSEGRPIQEAPPRGRGNTNTSATRGDNRHTPIRGEDHSGSMGTAHGVGMSSIRDGVRAYEGVVKGDDTGKGPRHTTAR